MINIKGKYQLSEWVNDPEELHFMERDMNKAGIPYGIMYKGGKYALLREFPRNLKQPVNLKPTPVTFERWFKPFKKRESLKEITEKVPN